MNKFLYDLSIVVPVYNEEESLTELCSQIDKSLKSTDYSFEVILVDDGSSDRSRTVIKDLRKTWPWLKGLFFRRNFGQTAAMAAGVDHSSGRTLLFLDADLQNDPHDIPKLVLKINEGYDIVSGWRKNRKDKAISRILPSIIANWLIRKVSGVDLHDLGCSLKAFRLEIIQKTRLYGEMHRFIPIYASAIGAKITELEVNHNPRIYGETKYGLSRTFKVLLDVITIRFLLKYSTKPMHFFGSIGLISFFLAGCSSVLMIFNKLINHISMVRSPLLLLSAMLFMIAVNFILLGILAEVLMRIYYESQNKPNYEIKSLEGDFLKQSR